MTAEASFNDPRFDAVLNLAAIAKQALHSNGNGTEPFVWEAPEAFTTYPRPAFPVEALPEYLQTYVRAVAEATQTAPDLCACYVLGSMAGAIARKVEIHISTDYREPLNLYLLMVAKPGERKSAILKETALPWDVAERALVEASAVTIAKAESRRRIVEKERDKYERDAANAKMVCDQMSAKAKALELAEEWAKLEVSATPVLRVGDVTPEKLSTILAEQGGVISVFACEGTLFSIAGGRYAGDGGSSFDGLLNGHPGDDLKVDRQSRPSVRVERPAITIAVAVQPDVVASIFKNTAFRERGLLGRFLYVWPQSMLGRRNVNPAAIPPVAREGYAEGVALLLAWPMPETPTMLTLSPEAKAVGDAFGKWIEPQLGDDGTLTHFTDWAGKLCGAAYRLMGVLHMAQYADKQPATLPPVSGECAERAVVLAKYFLAHAQIVYGWGGADPVLSAARKVVEWLKVRGLPTFVARQCLAGNRTTFPDGMVDVWPVLELLEDYRYVRRMPDPPHGGSGRKPSPSYAVNPAVLVPGSRYTELPPNDTESPRSVDTVYSVGGTGIEKNKVSLSLVSEKPQILTPNSPSVGDLGA